MTRQVNLYEAKTQLSKLVEDAARGEEIIIGLLVALYAPWFESRETFGPVLYWMTGPRLNNFWPEPWLTSIAASTGWKAAAWSISRSCRRS